MSTRAIPHVDYNFVQEAVRHQAKLRPERPAVIDEAGRRLTYCELDERSTRLALKLRSLRVRPDDRVAVWMNRSADLIVSLLAVLEAGGAYVPIDTSYPVERVTLMLQNSRARVCITDREAGQSITKLSLGIVDPTSDLSEFRGEDLPPPNLDPENLAYVIYTSGSTGIPKGVAMSHRGLSRLIRWQIKDSPPGLSTLQFTPICFDVTLQEVFSTLGTGGSLQLVSESVRRDPEQLLRVLDEKKIERLFLPYVAIQQLAKAAQRTGIVPQSLRQVVTAGEQLIVTESIAEFFGALPSCQFENQYGPTETHLVTGFNLTGHPTDWPMLPPIGSAAHGVALYNLDSNLMPVPEGEIGELYVGGDGLARGYLEAPGVTAGRFLPNPLSSESGARMYRTGDLVRIGAGGVVDFVGRSDQQIKVRGFRVEPAEVESALTNHPDVQQAAVGLRTIASDVNALVGYVVGTAAVSELAQHLRQTLPDYMVPARFVFLDSLPLTATGKVDHLRLSELPLPAAMPELPALGASVAETLRAIWERVLGHDEFDVEDDFFDVGGDSLLATWVVTEMSQALKREFDLSILLEDSTIAGITRTLEEMALQPTGSRGPSEVLTLRAGPSQRVLFLVHPLGGDLLAYKSLARLIRAPLRVLGLRWRPVAGDHEGPLSLQEMATLHLAQLRAVQPSGPYLLAGWSFGGVLAFEMAQQLVALGEPVDFLGLLDANPVLDSTSGRATSDSTLFDRVANALAEIDRKRDAGEAADDLAVLSADPYLSGLIGNTISDGVTTAHIRQNLQFTRDNLWATMNYRAVPYSGPVDLFQPDDSPATIRESVEVELRKLVVGPLRSHLVPGDHYSILRAPVVEAMARALDGALEGSARKQEHVA